MKAGRGPRALVAGALGAAALCAVTATRAAPTCLGYGFDSCSAPSGATMTAWLSSPYRSLGIYLGGANRACGDGNLSASWISTTVSMGWNLLPLDVGLRGPGV